MIINTRVVGWCHPPPPGSVSQSVSPHAVPPFSLPPVALLCFALICLVFCFVVLCWISLLACLVCVLALSLPFLVSPPNSTRRRSRRGGGGSRHYSSLCCSCATLIVFASHAHTASATAFSSPCLFPVLFFLPRPLLRFSHFLFLLLSSLWISEDDHSSFSALSLAHSYRSWLYVVVCCLCVWLFYFCFFSSHFGVALEGSCLSRVIIAESNLCSLIKCTTPPPSPGQLSSFLFFNLN